MILDQKATIPVAAEQVWSLMMDVPEAIKCVPGMEAFEPAENDSFKGVFRVRLGPISVRLEGKATITERNRDEWRAAARIEATDHRIKGAVDATSVMKLRPLDNGSTEIRLHTEAALFGKLGEFGQAIARRKADQIIAKFVQNVARRAATMRESGLVKDQAPGLDLR